MLTNDVVQTRLAAAIAAIKPVDDPILSLKVEVVRNALTLVALYSQSWNEFPGLRGLGLEEALELAEAILLVDGDITNVRLNFKALATIVQL